jgi:hypothetical protein
VSPPTGNKVAGTNIFFGGKHCNKNKRNEINFGNIIGKMEGKWNQ